MQKPTGSGKQVQRQKEKYKRQRAHHKQKSLKARRSDTEPSPAPQASGYFLQQMWQKLRLDDALEFAGIIKGGLPMGTIFMLVILMGVAGAGSLYGLVELLPQDAVLMAALGIQGIDEKQIYRGLARVSIGQYQQWITSLLQSLQTDPRTASRPDGVIGGDTTQVEKLYSSKIPGVFVLFLHSEKRFTRGAEIINTHYADGDKDYPLFTAFYEPNEIVQAERQEQQERRKAKVNGHKPTEVLTYIQQQVEDGESPELVILSGNRLSIKFRRGIDALSLPWLGVSDNRRLYQLESGGKKKEKTILSQIKPRQWVKDEDLGWQFVDLGIATSSIGTVRLIAAEHVADSIQTLYVMSDKDDSTANLSLLNLFLTRENAKEDKGILHQMLILLRLSREAGIRAENAAFDSWFCVPWFMKAVLDLGFQRVVTKPRATFKYHYRGKTYKLDQLWSLLKPTDFQSHTIQGITCQLASLKVTINGLGKVKLVFTRQPTRRGNKMLNTIILCTDTRCANDKVLRIYRLRWRIEVCYREVKQNHNFGKFHARNMETIYGQTILSMVAYLFISLLRLLVPPLRGCTPGWIIKQYVNVIVRLAISQNGEPVVDFPPWLMDNYGLPSWDSFQVPILRG